LKVSIFQKSLSEGLNLTTLKKLAALKSDFLVLPEYFFADQAHKGLNQLADRSQFALDWLSKVNEVYKGIIIGGTVVHKENDGSYAACPVISDGMVVDWYRKRNLAEYEKDLKPGQETGTYILGGHRFSVLVSEDVHHPEYFDEIAAQGIKTVFCVMRSYKKDESPEDKVARDDALFGVPSRKHGMYIIKCSSVGSLFDRPLQGRSMVVTPSGVSWRIAPQEEDMEIMKTLMINIPG
jgi:predicted amidohydrolase